MTEPLTITLKTLTPLWTGGVDGTCDRVHETGIIGSLRWWYEAIVRGLGGEACDPTEGGCIYKRERGETHERAYRRLCHVCRLFGCTGWRKRFALTVGAGTPSTKFCLATLDQAGQFNHWWLTQVFADAKGKRVPYGNVCLHLRFPDGAEQYATVFKGLLSLMSRYGGIGAKCQYGFGQFDWDGKLSDRAVMAAISEQLVTSSQANPTPSDDCYSLSRFWHLECGITDTAPLITRYQHATVIGDKKAFESLRAVYLPVSFDIRYKLPGTEKGLRQAYRMTHGKMAARKIFGTLKGEKRGSRIFVSHLHKRKSSGGQYRLHIWGFTKPQIGEETEGEVKKMFGDNVSTTMKTGPQLLGEENENET